IVDAGRLEPLRDQRRGAAAPDAAAHRIELAGEHGQERRLARPLAADNRDPLASERDVELAKQEAAARSGDVEAAPLDDWRARCHCWPFARRSSLASDAGSASATKRRPF